MAYGLYLLLAAAGYVSKKTAAMGHKFFRGLFINN